MWRRPILATLTLVLPFVTAACDLGAPSTADADGGVVARAGDRVLSVQEATELIAGRSQLPNQESVVRTMSDLWLDYMVLGQAAAEDSTLSQIDFDPLVQRRLEQELVSALRDSVIQVDTTLTEDELRELWNRDAPEVRAKTRHILLTFPENATPTQRDSVERLAGELRSRVLDGEGFVALAREYSDDSGTAARGGDLGWIERGQVIPALDEVAFSLEPGAVSEPVETPLGLHIVTVEDRETPDFDEQRDEFAEQVKSRRVFEAESTYVARIEEGADIQATEGALDIVREMAGNPGVRLSPRARERPVATYEGGAFTVGEYRAYLQSQSPRVRNQIARAPDRQLESFLSELARSELLVQTARDSGMEIPQSRRDSLAEQARTQLVGVTAQLGLTDLDVREGETRSDALERRVRSLLESIMADEESVVPLGALGYGLRSTMEAELYEVSFSRVVDAVARARAEAAGAADTAAENEADPGRPPGPGTPPDDAR